MSVYVNVYVYVGCLVTLKGRRDTKDGFTVILKQHKQHRLSTRDDGQVYFSNVLLSLLQFINEINQRIPIKHADVLHSC